MKTLLQWLQIRLEVPLLRLHKASLLALHILLGLFLTFVLLVGASRERPFWLQRARLISWWHGRACRILRVEVCVEGNLPQGSAVLLSNHVSWLDIPVLGSLLLQAGWPGITFVAKSEVKQWPALGWLATQAGTLYIERGRLSEIRTLASAYAKVIETGAVLTLFPEGTTSDGRRILPVRSGTLHSLQEMSAPRVPIVLRYRDADDQVHPQVPFIGEDSFLPHLWRLLAAREVRVEVRVLEACDPEVRVRDQAADCQARMAAALLS